HPLRGLLGGGQGGEVVLVAEEVETAVVLAELLVPARVDVGVVGRLQQLAVVVVLGVPGAHDDVETGLDDHLLGQRGVVVPGGVVGGERGGGGVVERHGGHHAGGHPAGVRALGDVLDRSAAGVDADRAVDRVHPAGQGGAPGGGVGVGLQGVLEVGPGRLGVVAVAVLGGR